MIDRKHDHVMDYISTELGAKVNLGSENNLLLKGVFRSSVIDKVFANYLKEYVECSHCREYGTKMEKDQSTRTYVMECKLCGATRCVANIKKRFVSHLKK